MTPHDHRRLAWAILGGLFLCPNVPGAAAQEIPGPADVGRVQAERKVPPPRTGPTIEVPTFSPLVTAPEGARDIRFTLKGVTFTGVTAFEERELTDLYAPYVGREITLDVVWMIAGALTERYRQHGYFLSRAYIPAQDIDDGAVTIAVLEGYVAAVELSDPKARHAVVRRMIRRLVRRKPLKIRDLESFLLRLNDLPGPAFQGVLEPSDVPDAADGAVTLALVPRPKPPQASLAVHDYGSRFLGPYQAEASYRGTVLPWQRTTLAGLVSLPTDELAYVALSHEVPIAPGLTLALHTDYTTAQPGYRLEPLDIDSRSLHLGVELVSQLIRQRRENLALSLGLDGRRTDSDTFGTPLTRDRTRALRIRLTGDATDPWGGVGDLDLTLSQGLAVFGASAEGDANLSRAEAAPDFRKVELFLTRQQVLGDWALITSVAGQLASGALYSSEEFGYGGQVFGRAYDASELAGDHGLAGALEVRYLGLELPELSVVPYAFYDVGVVWNVDEGQDAQASGSSAGIGVQLNFPWGLSGQLGIAQPLTRQAAAPLAGDGRSPRLLSEIRYRF